jgi:3-isopropylmalate/(R)-2-methylmalate dehydratase small subunit
VDAKKSIHHEVTTARSSTKDFQGKALRKFFAVLCVFVVQEVEVYLMKLHGFVHKFGDNIDTDIIIPATYLDTVSPQELAAHCMEGLVKEFIKQAKAGDIIVGGANFGCGSSREHAPIAIKAAGISCVIAESFARIFFRNAINIGLPVLVCPEAAQAVKNGDELEVDLAKGAIKNLTGKKTYEAAPFPPFLQELITAGGLIEYTKKRLALNVQR